MSQAVVIKSNKYGINLVLDKTMPFRELLVAIKEKFLESEKFFKDAKMAISFEGRELTQVYRSSVLWIMMNPMRIW